MILYPDVGGVRETFAVMADRLAALMTSVTTEMIVAGASAFLAFLADRISASVHVAAAENDSHFPLEQHQRSLGRAGAVPVRPAAR